MASVALEVQLNEWYEQETDVSSALLWPSRPLRVLFQRAPQSFKSASLVNFHIRLFELSLARVSPSHYMVGIGRTVMTIPPMWACRRYNRICVMRTRENVVQGNYSGAEVVRWVVAHRLILLRKTKDEYFFQ